MQGNRIIGEIFSLLNQYGVEHIVCSPGSRNAALLDEAARHEDFRKLVIVDERTAAFVALGISLVSKKAVALICTSGSAVLNYAPAVAESFYQGLPLIILSADRPEEWIDQDDSQTIQQNQILTNIVKGSYDISALRNDNDYLWYVNRIVNEGLQTALNRKKGPVHFNIHLSGTPDGSSCVDSEISRRIQVIHAPRKLEQREIKNIADFLKGKNILLVAGFLPPDHKLQQSVSLFSELPIVAVMAETVSNLHLPRECYIIDKVLFPLGEQESRLLKPDVVISIGGALISRKLKEYLRTYPPQSHISFSYSDNLIDCFKCLTTKIECDPAPVLRMIGNRLMKSSLDSSEYEDSYRKLWNKTREKAMEPTFNFPWCDLKALERVFAAIPEETNLFLSNGTAVRYAQIIPHKPPHSTYSNRGVSGIEGCTSTAIGASLVYSRSTCLITGDMSFSYDIGAITAHIADERMRLIVLDNNGGDIFRFIPATRSLSIREEYLCVAREFPIQSICESFGWEYYYANTMESLEVALDDFFDKSMAPKILHIVTSNSENSKYLTEYLKGYKQQ